MRLTSDYYDTDFELIYKGNRILIRNDGPEGESLFINGVLHDQNFGAYNGRLAGLIDDENGEKELIEVVLGGRETKDCLVYADGALIYSHIPVQESRTAAEKAPVSKKKKNGLFFPFLMILLIAVSMVAILPYLGGDSSREPSDEVFQEDSTPASGDDLQEDAEAPDSGGGQLEAPEAQDSYIEADYAWHYGKVAWTYQLRIPRSAYDSYKTVDRKKIRDYSYYVTDPTDDEYLAELAQKFKDAAKEENYSDLDMVKNIIFFVQNLEYVDDKVGTGYDEYPKFPLETLADQGGDCEDSAILLASLLRELGYGTVLIQFPDHMAVGVKGGKSIPGSYYEVDGTRYYYVETTSPGWEIGDVPEQMKGQPAKILSLNK